MEASCSRKRKRPCDEEDEQLDDEPIDDEFQYQSDEEELDEAVEKLEEQNYDIAIKAQQPATTVKYDDIQVTPFNLEDELEEGEFDKAGNFIFKKKEDLDETNNDTWAESIDWSRVEDSTTVVPEEKEERSQEADPPEKQLEPTECYKKMLRIMRSDETVQRTIRRLGNSVPKRRPNKNKFKEPETPEIAEARQKLDSMIELAHRLLENGDMDVYQKSYEDLEEAINS